jgi:hypothetical protein
VICLAQSRSLLGQNISVNIVGVMTVLLMFLLLVLLRRAVSIGFVKLIGKKKEHGNEDMKFLGGGMKINLREVFDVAEEANQREIEEEQTEQEFHEDLYSSFWKDEEIRAVQSKKVDEQNMRLGK